MLKKLCTLLIACVMVSMLAVIPVSAAASADRGLRAELYDFSEYAETEIGAAIDKAVNEGVDLFAVGTLIGEIKSRINNLTMDGDDLDYWYEETADNGKPADYFGLKIYGFLVPQQSGEYNLKGNIDNAYRLWIDGELWFDQWEGDYWTDKAPDVPVSLMPMTFEAGKVYEIYAEFVENWGGQQVILEWQIDGGSFTGIPNTVFYKTAEAAAEAAEEVLNPTPPAEAPAENINPVSDELDNSEDDASADDSGEATTTESSDTSAQEESTPEEEGNTMLIIILAVAGVVIVAVIVVMVMKKKK